MSDGTHIEWVKGPDGRKGATWNPITGCSLASPGCTNCYAMKLAGTRLRDHPSRAGLTTGSKAGPVWTGEVRFNEQWLTQPLRWKRSRMIFVCAHGDLFHERVPDAWIDRVFAVMALCPQHTFQVLTKRADRMREYFTARVEISPPLNGDAMFPRARGHVEQWANLTGMKNKVDLPWRPRHESGGYWWGFKADMPWPLPNVWLGVSVEDQARADERIPHLLATPAAVRWISAEPLLGRVDLRRRSFPESHYEDWLGGHYWDDVNGDLTSDIWGCDPGPKLDWVVCGGESGPGARPMHEDWARDLRDQCAAADVPFFFKQWGEWLPGFDECPSFARGWRVIGNEGFASVGKKRAGRLLDGQLHDAMPQVRA